MAFLQIYRELLSLTTFLRVHWNSKEVSYLSWQNTYPNLKTTCHIKLKFFLWTKLLENLLVAKYLITVTAPLSNSNFSQDTVIVYKKADECTSSDNEWQRVTTNDNEWKQMTVVQRMKTTQYTSKNGTAIFSVTKTDALLPGMVGCN